MKTETLVKTRWTIDPAHSEFGFRAKHLMITWVKGVFRDVDVKVFTDGDDFLSSEIEVRINASSIDTGEDQRDAHLKSEDFFDAENHRQIVFISKKMVKGKAENEYILYGTMAIRDIAVPVKLNVEYQGKMTDPWGTEKVGFSVTGVISRKDWELNWNTVLDSGGVLVGDEVRIDCYVQMVKLPE